MKKLKMSQELADLLQDKNEPCISMIIPLHREPAFRKEDAIQVDHSIDKLEKLLEGKYEHATVAKLMEKVRSLKGDISTVRGACGLGIFFSPAQFTTVTFPFSITEKIVVGKSFEIRDVLYKEFYYRDYFVLSLNKDKARLFKGNAGQLAEISDHNFPAVFDGVEYQVPVVENQVNNAAQETKRELSLTTGNSAEFYNFLDLKLLEYIDEETPLILAGAKKELAFFESGNRHRRPIAGTVNGSFNGYNHAELAEKSWQVMNAFSAAEEKRWIESLRELFGRELVGAGIQQAWRNAHMGKGNVLVVEKNLKIPGFASADGAYLWMRPPVEEHVMLADAVDDVIETVLEKGGRVVFVENGALAEFEGIALVNRY
jgi:hypothetical protein